MAAKQHIFFHGEGSGVAIDMAAKDYTGEDDLYLCEVRVHFSAVGGGNTLYLKIDSHQGEAWDSILDSQDMTAAADKNFTPGRMIRAVDHFLIAWTKSANVTWGIEVIVRPATEWD